MPLVIQYGPTLRSFKELPVTIGKNPDCDFSLEHPEILDRHAQFFFDQGQYWVKDLTGRNLVSINTAPVRIQAQLNPDNLLSLSPKGPTFRFLGDGRLAEIEEPNP
jgi:pSer/pThr/pTyr-binding forkhead associated (FHA) protein